MRIGIDGIALTIKFPCGTRTYATQLLSGLAKIDRKNEYIVFVPESVVLPKQDNVTSRIIPIPFPYLKRQLFFPFAVYKEQIDVFHYLHPYGAGFFSHPKIVTTIHDIQLQKIFRSVYNPKYLFQYFYTTVTRRGVFLQTNTFISVSETTRNEFIEKFNIRKPVISISQGVDSQFKLSNPVYVSKKSNYLLAFADYSPRKNISGVLTGYSLLSPALKNQYRLKIIVSTSFPVHRIRSEIKKFCLTNYVDLLINIPIRELRQLYRNARMLAFPSFYEGFGLPILEAMASGCPVITSNFGAMKEVAGDAAYLVNPYSVSEIAHAMETLLTHPNMQERLIKKGSERAKEFTWEQTARKTLLVYEQVYRS